MKKMVVIAIIACLLLLAVAGCSKTAEVDQKSQKASDSAAPAQTTGEGDAASSTGKIGAPPPLPD